MIFNGVDLVEYFGMLDGRDVFIVNDVYGRGPISQKTNRVGVPNMDGSHFQSASTSERVLAVKITLNNMSLETMRKNVETLSGLVTIKKVCPIIFSDEYDRVYFGILDGEPDWNEIIYTGQGTIYFACPDPHKYEAIKRTTALPNAINNEGTAETYPVFDLTVTQDTTRLSIANNSNKAPDGTPRSIILGRLHDVDDTLVDPKKLIMHDTMQSTSGWQNASEVDSGYVSGSFGVDVDGFYVEDWEDTGEPPQGTTWIGPSLKKSLPPLNSFTADIRIANGNDRDGNIGAVGIIEVYMRDANDQMVCKMQFGDTFHNAYENFGTFVTADKRKQTYPKNQGGWNNFDGLIRINRDTGYYYPYISMIDKNGNHIHSKRVGRIIPGGGIGSNPVTSIQIAMRKPFRGKRMYQRIKEIKVYDEIGEFEYPDYTVPISFKAGDRIKVNTATGEVLLNGESRTDLLDIKTDFFSLVEGVNILDLTGDAVGTVEYRHRFK